MEYRALFQKTNESLGLAYSEFNSAKDSELIEVLTYKIKYLELLVNYYYKKINEEGKQKLIS